MNADIDDENPTEINKDPEVGFNFLEQELIKTKKIPLSGYGDYSGWRAHKHKSGKIIITGWGPCNVDCDDGSYDMRNWSREYINFDDFVNKQ